MWLNFTQRNLIEFGSCGLLHLNGIHRINAELSETDEDVAEENKSNSRAGRHTDGDKKFRDETPSVAHSLSWARILNRSEGRFTGSRDRKSP
jgi:hypothetical protein